MSAFDPVSLSEDLIRCPSITPIDAGALDVLQAFLERCGFVCHRKIFEEDGTAPVDNLYARLGTESPNLCFAGHTDVVPPGDESLWTYPPFDPTINDGVFFGRGATDMKCAIAAFAAASLTGKDPMATGFAAMRFGWFAYLVPFLFVVVPELLMRGDAISIFLVTGKSILGIWFVSVAVMGYAIRHISPLMRVLFAIAGAGMFVPDKILNIGIPLALIGIVLGGALIALDWTRNRQASPT